MKPVTPVDAAKAIKGDLVAYALLVQQDDVTPEISDVNKNQNKNQKSSQHHHRAHSLTHHSLRTRDREKQKAFNLASQGKK